MTRGLISKQSKARRGSPLVMFGFVLVGWAILRAATWNVELLRAEDAMDMPAMAVAQSTDKQTIAQPMLAATANPPLENKEGGAGQSSPRLDAPQSQTLAPYTVPARPAREVPAPADHLIEMETAAAHQLIYMAAMSYMPVPKAVQVAVNERNNAPVGLVNAEARSLPGLWPDADNLNADRWSLDTWAFWREGSASARLSQGLIPTYGASQTGAVARYSIAPSSGHRPNAYARFYSTLQGRSEQEVAAGLSAKPLPNIPLRLHGEARALRSGGKTFVRAAGFVTSALPPVELPAGFSGEIYGQAGYVTGRNRTAFADSQAHVMREVAQFDLAKVKLGGAAFAGAQKGAERVDIGPSMRVDLKLGDTPARISVDWRERVAGRAEPGSGLAVTLSTRF